MIYSSIVIAQLSNDAPYAWFLYDRAKSNSRYRFDDFTEQADVVETYLDALLVASEAGEPIQDWLDKSDWGYCFVIACLAIRLDDAELFAMALDNLNENQETHYREVVDACLWDNQQDLAVWLMRLYEHKSPVAQQSGIAVARSIKAPLHDRVLATYLQSEHDAVKVQCLYWLGENNATSEISWIQQHYNSENDVIAFAAVRAGTLLEDSMSQPLLEKFALTQNPFTLDALALLFYKEPNSKLIDGWLAKLWEDDSLSARIKLHGTAVGGLTPYVEKLLDSMQTKKMCRVSGESFTLLTGVDIEDFDLDVTESEMDAKEPCCDDCGDGESCCDDDAEPCCDDCEDEPCCDDCEDGKPCAGDSEHEHHHEETELSLAERRREDPYISDWEDDLPFPCVDKVTTWWQANGHELQEEKRYLAGLETTEENLQKVLLYGNQHHRHLAALNLMVNFNKPYFDPSWPPILQNKLLE